MGIEPRQLAGAGKCSAVVFGRAPLRCFSELKRSLSRVGGAEEACSPRGWPKSWVSGTCTVEGAPRVPFARRSSQNGARAEAGGDRSRDGQSGGARQQGSRSDQDSKRRLLENGLRRKQTLRELDAKPAERQPPRRNPGGHPKWEEKLVSTTENGVPLLYVLPEDEQQGAEWELR